MVDHKGYKGDRIKRYGKIKLSIQFTPIFTQQFLVFVNVTNEVEKC